MTPSFLLDADSSWFINSEYELLSTNQLLENIVNYRIALSPLPLPYIIFFKKFKTVSFIAICFEIKVRNEK